MVGKKARKPLVFLFVLPLFLMLILAALQVFLQQLLPTSTLIPFVARELAKELSVRTSIEDVRLTVFPRPAIQVLNVRFADPISGNPWIQAEVLEVKLKIIPLFQGKVLPEKILLKRPVIQIQRGLQGEWIFMGLSPSSRDIETPQKPIIFQKGAIEDVIIKDASIKILDQRAPSREPHLILQEMDAHLQGISRDIPIRLKAKGHFPHRLFELNTFSIRGELLLGAGPLNYEQLEGDVTIFVSDLPVEVSRRYFREFLDLHLYSGEVDLKAHLSLHPHRELDMSGEFYLKNYLLLVPQYASKPLTGEEALLNFELTRSEKIISVKHVALELEGPSIWGHGVWARDLHGKPWYGLSLHASDLSYEKIRTYLPDNLLSPRVVDLLEHATSKGSIDIPLLEITKGGNVIPGEIDSGSIHEVSLKVGFREFGLNTRSDLLPLESLNGEIFINGNEIQFRNLSGNYGSSRMEQIVGNVSRTAGSGTDLNVMGHLNLSEIQKGIRQISKPEDKQIHLSHVSRTEGVADVRLHLISSDQKDVPYLLDGTIDFSGAGFQAPSFPFYISGIYGRLTLNNNESEPFSLKAVIGQLPTRIEGVIRQVLSTSPIMDLKFSADPTEEQITRWFPPMQNRLTIQEGAPEFTLTVDGSPRSFRFNTRLDLTKASFSFANWIRKEKGILTFLEFKGHAEEGETLVIDDGRYQSSHESISFSGRIEGRASPYVTVNVHTDRISLQPLSQIMPVMAGAQPDSLLSGDLDLSFIPGKEDSLSIMGDLYLHQAVLRPWFSHRLFRNITGTIQFSGKEILGRGITCKWGDLPITFDVHIPQIDSPIPELRVDVPVVHFRPLSEEIFSAEKSRFELDRKALLKSDLQVDLHLHKINDHRGKLQDFQARLVLKDGVLSIPSFMTLGLEGAARGQGMIDFVSEDQPQFQAAAQISGVNTERYLELFPHNRTFYAGEISGSIAVKGKLYPDLIETAHKMTGDANLLIQSPWERNYLTNFTNEIVHRVEIMMGRKDALFRILEYDEMGGNFTIQNGTFHSKDFYIYQYHKYDVSGLTLDKFTAAVPIRIKYNVLAAGRFDFLNLYIDCYIMAQPFSIANRFIKKVPLAGKVLTGKDESLYSLYFRYAGHTGHEYQNTEKEARLDRISFQMLPLAFKEALKEPPG